MDRTRLIIFAGVVAVAMLFGVVLVATAFGHSNFAPAIAAITAASPSPGAARDHHFRGGGLHGHPCGGHSNEDPAHEKTETAAEEAAENAACPTPSPSTAATP
jgi:hypothetical protein